MDVSVIVLCILTFFKHELPSYPVRRMDILGSLYYKVVCDSVRMSLSAPSYLSQFVTLSLSAPSYLRQFVTLYVRLCLLPHISVSL